MRVAIDENRVLTRPFADILAYLVNLAQFNYDVASCPQAVIALASHYIVV